jgi:hypothetical protein
VPGAPDPEYVLARRVLLDALQALGEQRSAVVIVGAQAIYLHTGDTDLAVAPYTTDGDVAIDPSRLRNDPKLAEALGGAGFYADTRHVGTWIMSRSLEGRAVEVKIDLMVPEAVGGPGRRGARLGPHGNRAARKARGLEATLVDQQRRTIEALEDEDERAFEVAVAGPAALLVAKLHKIAERVDTPGRREDKDALDILRLLQAGHQATAAKTRASLEHQEARPEGRRFHGDDLQPGARPKTVGMATNGPQACRRPVRRAQRVDGRRGGVGGKDEEQGER